MEEARQTTLRTTLDVEEAGHAVGAFLQGIPISFVSYADHFPRGFAERAEAQKPADYPSVLAAAVYYCPVVSPAFAKKRAFAALMGAIARDAVVVDYREDGSAVFDSPELPSHRGQALHHLKGTARPLKQLEKIERSVRQAFSRPEVRAAISNLAELLAKNRYVAGAEAEMLIAKHLGLSGPVYEFQRPELADLRQPEPVLAEAPMAA